MFKSIVDMVVYPLYHFEEIFLHEFVIFCLIMFLFLSVMRGFFNVK